MSHSFKNNFLLLIVIYFCTICTNTIAQTTKFIIEEILVEGNSKTRSNVIYENLSFTIGDSLSEDQIYQAVDDLRRLELFGEVKLHPRPGSEPGYLQLIIQVDERYWPRFQFKGGFSELDGWYLTPVSLNLDNIFGLGNYTNMELTFGDRITSIKLNYINPNIFNSNLDFHFRLIASGREFIHYINNQKLIQNVPQGGYYIGFRSREGLFKRFLFGLDIYSSQPDSFASFPDSKQKFYDFPPHIAQYLKDKLITSAFSIYFNLDKRDHKSYPSSGWWSGFWYTQADEQLGSEVAFTRFILDLRLYQRIYKKLIIASRFKYGIVSSNAPFYEKFYLGGPNSLRGFPDRSLSPVGGGDQLHQAGLELRFPITSRNFPNHFLTGVLFFDGGANLLKNENLILAEIYRSWGFGFRFRFPFIGHLRLDFAYPINEGSRRIHISLGHTF